MSDDLRDGDWIVEGWVPAPPALVASLTLKEPEDDDPFTPDTAIILELAINGEHDTKLILQRHGVPHHVISMIKLELESLLSAAYTNGMRNGRSHYDKRIRELEQQAREQININVNPLFRKS